MPVEIFEREIREEDFSDSGGVCHSLEKDLTPSQWREKSPMKLLKRRQIRSASQLWQQEMTTPVKCLQKLPHGGARLGVKTACHVGRALARSARFRNKFGILNTCRTRNRIVRKRKIRQFSIDYIKSYSESSQPFACWMKTTPLIRGQPSSSRAIFSVCIGHQSLTSNVQCIPRQFLNLSVRTVARLGTRRIGSRSINSGVGSSPTQLVYRGVRHVANRLINTRTTRDQRGKSREAGKRLVEFRSQNCEQKWSYSLNRLRTSSREHRGTSKDSHDVEDKAEICGPNHSRSNDGCQYTVTSCDNPSTHRHKGEQRIDSGDLETKCHLDSGTSQRKPRRDNGWLSGVRLPTLLLVCLLTSVADTCPYAGVDPRHTMCVFMPRQCPGKMLIRSGELTCHDKERILTKHNMLRQEAALGQVRGQPAAINMKTMVWDDELAMVAQRWADQCMPGHDRSRNVPRFAAGQNVAAVWTYDRDEGVEPDFLTQVEAWFMEVDQHGFSKGAVDPFKFSKPTGHYTQLVWADTYLVGCGYSYYHDAAGNGYTKLYVCNYGPGGNVVGGSMYKVGYPGQPYCVANGLRPSTDYQGLCEEDGVNYKSMCSMGGSSMFHKPKTSSLMMLMDGNSVVDDFAHSHARSNSPTHPMEVMHPDPPHMEMHDMMHHRSSMMRNGQSRALHRQQSHMMLPPPPLPHNHLGGGNHGGDNGLIKTIQAPFAGLVNALSPWNFLNRFKMS